jgi:ketosteroid isomerase-like protein
MIVRCPSRVKGGGRGALDRPEPRAGGLRSPTQSKSIGTTEKGRIGADLSRENVELLRRAYEVFDTDVEALLSFLDPEIDWVSPGDSIEPGPRHGHQGVRDAYAATATAWERPTHTAEDFIDAGEKVLVSVTFRGRGRGSGMEAEQREFHVWTVREGMVSRFEWFYRREEALEAAGYSGVT